MNKSISFAASVLGLGALPLLSRTSDDNPRLNPRLKKALERFPEADADNEGVLTKAEATAFKKRGTGQPNPGKAQPDEESIDPEALKPLLKLYEAREFEGVKYRLLKPINLAENPGKKYPMILSLHGAGGSGNDNVRNLRSWNEPMAQEELRRKHPCFIVVPQSVGPWRTPGMAAKFTEMVNRGHNVSQAAFVYAGDSPVEGGVTKYASDRCDKTADVWDWLFDKKRGTKFGPAELPEQINR